MTSVPPTILGAPSLRLPFVARVRGHDCKSVPCLVTLTLLAFTLTACRSHDFPQYAPNYREYVYVTNGGSGTVTVLDGINIRVDRELRVGQNPVAVAANPTRNEVYVVNAGGTGGQGSLSVINAENNTVAATIPLHRQPVSIDLDATGALAYVANSGSDTVSVLDLKGRRELTQISVGSQPVAARITPDGRTLVVANRRANSVSIVSLPGVRNPANFPVRQVFAGCPGAGDVVILPDSSKAFVACAAGHQVMVIAVAQSKTNPAQPDRLETLMDVGRGPIQLALKPDGGELFAINSLSGSISEVVTNTNDVGGEYMIGDNPVGGLVSRDNSLLYVGNLGSQVVNLYAVDDSKISGYIRVGDGPSAMAFSFSGSLLFIVDARSSDIAVVRTASNSLFTILPTGRAPNAIAIKAFNLP